jgi:hypothetical protein
MCWIDFFGSMRDVIFVFFAPAGRVQDMKNHFPLACGYRDPPLFSLGIFIVVIIEVLMQGSWQSCLKKNG